MRPKDGRRVATARRGGLAALAVALSLGPGQAAQAQDSAARAIRWVAHPSRGYEISATEISVADFLACRDAGRCPADSIETRCNGGDPNRRDHPINCITHDGAEALCAFLGGRLCTNEEWMAACRGTDGRAFAYGPEFQPSRCQAGSYERPGPGGRTTMAVGSVADCEGGLSGLFDMAGNVSEWISDCKGDYCKFRGVAYVGNEPVEHFAGCGSVCSGNDRALRSPTVGVRCCRE